MVPVRGFSPSGDFLHRRLAPGVDLFCQPTRRFRTVLLRLYLLQPLGEAPASALSLAASVLRQGTAPHPSRRSLYGELDGLYGAELDLDTGRIGEVHLLEAELSLPADRLTGEPGCLDRAVGLLGEVLRQPMREGRGFPARVLGQERRHLKEAIAAARNHKPGYASLRCVQAVCAREPYRIGRFGTPRALDRQTPEGLWGFWASALSARPLAAYAVGEFDPEALAGRLEGILVPGRARRPSPVPPVGFRAASPARPLERTERSDVSQARICLAFRSNTPWGDPLFSAQVLASCVLGGGSHAKLFRELREKASLAYDAYASLEKSKGLLLLTAGVDPAHRRRAEGILLDQVEAVRRGRISRQEWQDSRRTLLNRVRTLGDSPGRAVSLHLEGWLNGSPRGLREILGQLRRARPEEASEAARRWAHAASYCLTRKGRP